MFNVDMFNLAVKSERFHNPLTIGGNSVTIGAKEISIRNIGHLTQMVVEHLYNTLGGVETVNRLLVLNEKKFNGFTVVEKFSLFEKGNTIPMQGVVFEQLFTKVTPTDFHADKVNSAWEEVLESLGFKKPVMASFVQFIQNESLKEVSGQEVKTVEEVKVPEVQAPVTSQEAQSTVVKTVELVPTITVNKGTSIISEATIKNAEEATVDVVLKAALDEMSDETFEALKGLIIDEILVTKKLDPSKAAVAREILMESVTLDILKSDNPQEAILAILYEKVVSKENFETMVVKAEKESEKVPTTLVEALDVIEDGKLSLGRQYPKRRKGKR